MLPFNLIAIQSVPRSGSSWLGQIFKSSLQVEFRFQPLYSFAFKNRIGPLSTREQMLRFFSELMETDDDYIHQRDAFHAEYPDLGRRDNITHLVMKEVRHNHIVRHLLDTLPELKTVGLVRHPCAVIDSWIHAPKEFKPEWKVEEQWRSAALKNQGRPDESFGFDKWKETAQLFLDLEQERPAQMRVVRYADLNSDPMATVRDLFLFCELKFMEETKTFIQQSQSKRGSDPNSVYRLKRPDDAWKTRLPEYISATILEELEGSPLARFL